VPDAPDMRQHASVAQAVRPFPGRRPDIGSGRPTVFLPYVTVRCGCAPSGDIAADDNKFMLFAGSISRNRPKGKIALS
jgi:hypothetical protein